MFFYIHLHWYQEFISILIECFFHNIFSFLSGLSIIRQALFLVYIQVILQLHYHIVAKSVLLAHTGLAVFTITSAYPSPSDTSHKSWLSSWCEWPLAYRPLFELWHQWCHNLIFTILARNFYIQATYKTYLYKVNQHFAALSKNGYATISLRTTTTYASLRSQEFFLQPPLPG